MAMAAAAPPPPRLSSSPPPLGGLVTSLGLGAASAPPPGGLGAPEAARQAEALFEKRTVADVRAIEGSTRAQITAKKQELRNLLGESYRDLLAAADLIGEMHSTGKEVVGGVHALQVRRGTGTEGDRTAVRTGNNSRIPHTPNQDAFGELAARLTSSSEGPAASHAQAASTPKESQRELTYGVGCRVKFLLDTPEVLYGALDDGDVLFAARRFHAAVVVREQLSADDESRRIVAARFPLVEHQWPLVAKFEQKVVEASVAVADDPSAPNERIADAAVAEALLRSEQASQALARFLERREAVVLAAVRAASEGQDGALRRALSLARSAVVSARALFIGDGVGGRPLVSAPLAAAATSSSSTAPDGNASSQVLFAGVPDPSGTLSRAWAAACRRSAELLAPLPPEEVARAADAWLQRLARGVADLLPKALERALADSGATGVGALADVEASMRAADDAAATDSYIAGDATFLAAGEALLGRPLDLFAEVFDAPFVATCAAVTERSLAIAWQETAAEGVAAACAAAAEAPAPIAGRFDGVELAPGAAGATDAAESFEERLAATAAGGAKLLARLNTDARARRSATLAPAIASAAEKAAEVALADVAGRASRVVGEGSAGVLPALVIARVCDVLATSNGLTELLGPPKHWGVGAAAASRKGDGTRHNLDLRRLGLGVPGGGPMARWASKFQEVALAARAHWSGWVVEELREGVTIALGADQLLASDDPPRSWEAVTNENGVPLPAHISPPAADLAFAACREAARVVRNAGTGGTVASAVAQLGNALSATYVEVLAERLGATPPLSEKGVLQMIFDLWGTLALLAPPAGEPPGADDAARRAKTAEVLRALSSRLDPIDWATYEPVLWSRGAASVMRVRGLLSLRGGVRSAAMPPPPPGQTSSTTGAGVDAHNTICSSTPASRFTLLPVAAPAMAVAEARAPASATSWASPTLFPDEWRAGAAVEDAAEDAGAGGAASRGSSAIGGVGLAQLFSGAGFKGWGGMFGAR